MSFIPNNQGLVSVVIPCYNVQAYLDQCLESVCAQSYQNLQIILVDDGSKDDTPALCDQWAEKDDRIVVMHVPNGGLSSARNNGWSIAKGEYITFIDSDDYIDEQYVSKMVTLADAHSLDLVLCGFEKFDNDGNRFEPITPGDASGVTFDEFAGNILSGKYYPSAWAKMYRTEAFCNLRYKQGILFEDTYFWGESLKVIDDLSVGSVSDLLYFYRWAQGSIMNRYNGRREHDVVDAWGNICNNAAKRFPRLQSVAMDKLLWAYFELLDRSARVDGEEAQEQFDLAADWLSAHKDQVRASGKFQGKRKLAFSVLLVNRPAYRWLVRKFLS